VTPVEIAARIAIARAALLCFLEAMRAGHPLDLLLRLRDLAWQHVASTCTALHRFEHPGVELRALLEVPESPRLRLLRALGDRLYVERHGQTYALRPLPERDLDDAAEWLALTAAALATGDEVAAAQRAGAESILRLVRTGEPS
jgi:hypothetical protein